MPNEFATFIKYLKQNSRLNEVDISVHCHNDLGCATANSISAIKEGVSQVECTINGIGERAGNTALEEVVAILDTRSDYYNCKTNIITNKIYEASLMVSEITGFVVQNNKSIVGKNAFKHESGIHQAGVLKNKKTYEIMDPRKFGIYTDNMVIGIHSGKNAIVDKMKNMNFNINNYDIEKIVFDIKKFFETSKTMTDEGFKCIVNSGVNIVKKYDKK